MLATTLGLSWHEIARIDARTPIDGGELGVDSLDLISLARMVSRFFDLYESGSEEYLLQRRTVGGWTQTVLDVWNAAPSSLTFRTSGSTGEPTDCRHALATLHAEIDVLAALFSERTRIISTVPRHHIYGFLFTVLLPRELGIPVENLIGASASEIRRALAPGDLLVGVPLRFDDLAEAGASFCPNVVGVTSTGPCRATTIVRLVELGLVHLFEIYGSSQTAGIGWRSDPRDPYRLFPYWSLAPDGDALIRTDGALGYGEPIALPDILVRRDAGFEVAARVDGAVSIGGVNVFPARIAAIIAEHPNVVACAVRPMRASEGDRLKAFVVIDPRLADHDATEARSALRRWLRTTFSVAELPKPVTFGRELPRDAQGKLADW